MPQKKSSLPQNSSTSLINTTTDVVTGSISGTPNVTDSTITKSEQKFRNLAMKAGPGLLLLQGPTFIIEMANEAYLTITGKTSEELTGKLFFSVLPKENNDLKIRLTSLLQTGISFTFFEVPTTINRLEKEETVYLNYVYRASREENNFISGIICAVTDVTDLVKAKFAVAENDRQFRAMVMESPLAMVIFRGRDFVIETVNTEKLTKIWRKEEKDVLGKKLLEVFPEMKGQQYPELLTSIFNNGKAIPATESIVQLNTAEGINTFYLEIGYSPLFEIDGTVSGIIVTTNDITRHVITKERLEMETARLKLSSQINNLATWELDFTSDTLVHCTKLPVIYGLPPSAKLTNLQISQFIHPDDMRDVVDKAYTSALTSGKLIFDARVIWQDKSVHWIRSNGKMVFNDAKVLTRLYGTVEDVTVEKEKDEYILQLAAIVESSTDAIISTKLDGTVTTWNDAATNMFGYAATEMIGENVSILFPRDQMASENTCDINNPSQNYSFEVKRIKKDNSTIDISFNISPIRNNDGVIVGMSKIARDITKQKQHQNEIISSEARFHLLANTVAQFIWTSDNKGQSDYSNDFMHNFTGINKLEFRKNGWLQMVHPDDRESNIKKWQHSVDEGEDFSIEHRLIRNDGEYIWHLTRAIPQRDETGKIELWIGTSTNIHEIKENDQNRDFFISMASHELNTPVTTIRGYVDLLAEEFENNNNPFVNESLTTISQQIVTLTTLIKNLLDLSKIKAGILELYKEHFYIIDFINKILQELKVSHQFNFHFEENNDVLMFADRARITQVLVNFLTNAIKYSPQDKLVTISYKIVGEEVIIGVKDAGIGITKINQQKIFQRFFRVSGKSEKTYPGFGIGLFIASEIIEKHNGRIWVESELGEGSTFYCALPINKTGN